MADHGEREELVEAVAAAWRPLNPAGRIESHPAWSDLDDAGRLQAFEIAIFERALERALDPRGLSSTGRAVLRRITGEG